MVFFFFVFFLSQSFPFLTAKHETLPSLNLWVAAAKSMTIGSLFLSSPANFFPPFPPASPSSALIHEADSTQPKANFAFCFHAGFVSSFILIGSAFNYLFIRARCLSCAAEAVSFGGFGRLNDSVINPANGLMPPHSSP